MRRFWGAVVLLAALEVHALELRVCTLDQPFHPFTMPDGSGQAQELLRQAAKGSDLTVANVMAPRLRCREMLKAGEVDAIMSGYLPEREEYGVFPKRGGRIDETMQLGAVRYLVYRQRGSKVGWHGQQLRGLGPAPVGVLPGMAVTSRIVQAGGRIDEGAKTIEQNFEKLAVGRLAAVVALESDAQQLLDQKFKDRIDVLPIAFDVTPVYLHVNPIYYRRYKADIELYWKAIRKTRTSPAYQQYLKRAKASAPLP